jgi:hypothetical protein
MSIFTRADLKAKFVKGVIPAAQDFADLIDSAFSLEPTENQISGLTLNASPDSGTSILLQKADGTFERSTWGNLPGAGSPSGEVNNGENIGVNSPSILLFDGKPSLNLQFRGIKFTGSNIDSSYNATDKNYEVSINTTNLKTSLSLNNVTNHAQMRQEANRWATAFSAATSVASGSRWLFESSAAGHAKRYILHENMPFSDKSPGVASEGSSFSLGSSHHGKVVKVSGATTITLNTGLTTGLWAIIEKEDSSNEITFAAGGGATLKSAGTKLSTQYTAATVWHEGSGVFYVFGALST